MVRGQTAHGRAVPRRTAHQRGPAFRPAGGSNDNQREFFACIFRGHESGLRFDVFERRVCAVAQVSFSFRRHHELHVAGAGEQRADQRRRQRHFERGWKRAGRHHAGPPDLQDRAQFRQQARSGPDAGAGRYGSDAGDRTERSEVRLEPAQQFDHRERQCARAILLGDVPVAPDAGKNQLHVLRRLDVSHLWQADDDVVELRDTVIQPICRDEEIKRPLQG